MVFRIVFAVILFASALLAPLWLSVVIAVVGLVLFPSYYELVGAALLSDFVFGVPESRFFGFQFVSTIIVFLVVFGADLFRKKMLR